jgi:hypothetical protein
VGRIAALLIPLVVYYEVNADLWRMSVWWDVAWIAVVLMPVVFALVLVSLPLRTSRALLPAGLGFVALTVVLTFAHFDVFANFTRLGATTLLAWWFLTYFETVEWVVLVAAIIPFVDAYSVWRGPTKQIVAHHAHVFNVLSFAFPIPGEHAAANLGVSDLLFFALFLGAAQRFGLRVFWTWLGLVASLGATIAITVWWNLNGLPALPGLSLGFVLPNVDLLWRQLGEQRRLRREARVRDGADVTVGRPSDDV